MSMVSDLNHRSHCLWWGSLESEFVDCSIPRTDSLDAILNLYTPPPQLRALGWTSQQGMRFSVSGEAGQAVQVQRSSDLLGWQDWFGVVLGPSPSELNDPDTASGPPRFYRAVVRVRP
jgi:hypothetical protein